MPFTALDITDENNHLMVYSWELLPLSNLYQCPHCKSEMIVVAGRHTIQHFRHKVKCHYHTEPESEEHLYLKKFLYDKLSNLGYKPRLEYKVGKRIADIYLEDNGRKGVIECQCSSIPMDEVYERNYDYNQSGCHVMWVLGENNYRRDRIRHVERFLKALNYGVIYGLDSGDILGFKAVHFRGKTEFKWLPAEFKSSDGFRVNFDFNKGFDKGRFPVPPTRILRFREKFDFPPPFHWILGRH